MQTSDGSNIDNCSAEKLVRIIFIVYLYSTDIGFVQKEKGKK